MNFHARNLSVTLMAAVSGIALSVCLSPAFAQTQDSPERNRVNADGMPTTHSTPSEKVETARINRQVGADNRAVDDRTQADNNRYQAQQSQYQGQLQDNRTKQAEYDDNNARYNGLRARYAAERDAYHRAAWPSRNARWSVMERDTNLIGGRVQLMNGRRVGTVTDTSHGRSGSVTALLVRLDNNKTVWLDATDVRYDRANRVIMTNLDRGDLRRMADQRL
jgi:sporulation protein YlmC with PRC-barrel domain